MKRVVSLILFLLMLFSLLPAIHRAAADDGSITFTESEDFPLPTVKTSIPKGHPFTIGGTVRSDAPLVSLCAEIRDSDGTVVESAKQTFKESKNVTECQLVDPTYSDEIECLSEMLHFENLNVGSFTFHLHAEDASGLQVTLCSAAFSVTADTWITLLPNNLRDSYTKALAFFGEPERFLFRYKFETGRHITVDSAWRKQYCTHITGVNGTRWSCHVDAVPYFERAKHYIENTYVRIHGKCPDTGAVRLADLVTFNGSLVQRYISSLAYVSHHSFGTAIDINAASPSFRNKLENRPIIYREVHDNLTYNGFETINGKVCYDFTYTGSAQSGPKKVPEPLLNYLLYELGFYRAGFSWGFYYPHACDGMHFTLTEIGTEPFTDGPNALRKVFTYLDETDVSADWNPKDVKRNGTTPYVVYDGTAQTPRVTVKDPNGRPVLTSKYTVRYRDNTDPGTGRADVTMKSTGEVFPLWFKIYLPPTASTTVKNVADGIRLRWKKVDGAKGYVIYRRAWNLIDRGWTTFERWNNTAATEWTDTKVYAGTRYQYGVKAYFNDPMDRYNLGLVGPLKTTVRITTRTLNGVTAGKRSLTAKWSQSSVFSGYELQIATDEAFTKNVKTVDFWNAKTYGATVKSLHAKTVYFVRVRSVHRFEGVTYYGEWSNVLNCKTR